MLHQSGQAEQYVHSGHTQMVRGPPQLQERFHSPFNSFRHPFAVPHFNGAPSPFALFNQRLPSTQGLPFPPQPFPPFLGAAQIPRKAFGEQPSENTVNVTSDKNDPPKMSPKDLNGNSIELHPHMQDPLHAQNPHPFHNTHQKEVLKFQQAPPAQEPSNKPVSSTTTSQCSNVSSSSSSTSSRSQSSTPKESIVFKNQNTDCRPPMFSILDTFYPKKLEF